MKLMRLIVLIATLFAGVLLMAAECSYPYTGTESTYTLHYYW